MRRVPLLAIATMIHGGLLAAVGLLLLVASGVYWFLFQRSWAADTSDTARIIGIGVPLLLLLMAFFPIFAGLLQVYAGYRLRTFRSRTLMVVALLVGLVSVVTPYCFPSAIALLIWGAILLADPNVEQRIRLGAMSPTLGASDGEG